MSIFPTFYCHLHGKGIGAYCFACLEERERKKGCTCKSAGRMRPHEASCPLAPKPPEESQP